MSKIYVVYDGYPEDSSIIGVTTHKEAAEKMQTLYKQHYDDCFIDEYEDIVEPDERLGYLFEFDTSGNIVYSDKHLGYTALDKYDTAYCVYAGCSEVIEKIGVYVYGNSKDEAVNKAKQRYTEFMDMRIDNSDLEYYEWRDDV